MGRRRKYFKKNKTQNEGGGQGPKTRKLNMGKLDSFEYHLKNMLNGVEGKGTIFGNICSKSVNLGITEAKNYVEVLAQDGNIEQDKAAQIVELLNRYSRLR